MNSSSSSPHGFQSRDDAELQLAWISGDLAKIARSRLVVSPVRTIATGILLGAVYLGAAYGLVVLGSLAVAATVEYFAR